jgi:tetratricopeptide (TPR) repeat protein
MVRSAKCLAYLSWQILKFCLTLRRRHDTLWGYLFSAAEKLSTEDWARACVAKWLLSGALVDRDPKRLLLLYKKIINTGTGVRLRNETAIAIFESAVWLEDREVAERLLLTLSSVRPVLGTSTIDRLRQLHSWRFRKDMARAHPLLSPLTPGDFFLPYLWFLARAVVADSMNNKQDALNDYRRALALLPRDSREYAYALDRCNHLMNELAP